MKFKVRVFLGEQDIPREDWKYLVINNKNVNRNGFAIEILSPLVGKNSAGSAESRFDKTHIITTFSKYANSLAFTI